MTTVFRSYNLRSVWCDDNDKVNDVYKKKERMNK